MQEENNGTIIIGIQSKVVKLYSDLATFLGSLFWGPR